MLRWVQFVLDNFKDAEEVASEFKKGEIELVATNVPGSESPALLHLSVSDIKGNPVIIEAYEGKYHIHLSPQFNVMTNDPNFEIQLKINDYWLWQWSDKNPFPSHTIPGGPFPADRFERATYYYQQLQDPNSIRDSLAQSRSVLANVSVPIGMQGFKGHPNIAPTLWTTISDHNQLIYYFYNIRTPDVVWVDLNGELPDDNIAKLDLVTENNGVFTNHNFIGCVNRLLKATQDPYKPVKTLV